MSRLQKILYILSWIPAFAVKAVLWFIGLFVVAFWVGRSDQSKHWAKWARVVWGNDEEGYPINLGQSAWWWYAMRNPVNNSRYWFKDRIPQTMTNWRHYDDLGADVSKTIPMEPANMLEKGQAVAWRWSWSGPFAGFRRVWLRGSKNYSEIWFGWKVGSDVPGMGLTAQVRLNREIGR